MVAEQNILDMQKRLEHMERNTAMYKRNLDELETMVKELNDMKDSFGDELATRLANINNDVNTMEGLRDFGVQ